MPHLYICKCTLCQCCKIWADFCNRTQLTGTEELQKEVNPLAPQKVAKQYDLEFEKLIGLWLKIKKDGSHIMLENNTAKKWKKGKANWSSIGSSNVLPCPARSDCGPVFFFTPWMRLWCRTSSTRGDKTRNMWENHRRKGREREKHNWTGNSAHPVCRCIRHRRIEVEPSSQAYKKGNDCGSGSRRMIGKPNLNNFNF